VISTRHWIPLLFLLYSLGFLGCSEDAPSTDAPTNAGENTPTEGVQPDTVVLNGHSLEADGRVEFSLTAFQADGQLLRAGSLALTEVRILEASLGEAALATLEVDGLEVCGDIKERGALSAILSFDASSSMTSSDPDNLRLEAAAGFLTRMTVEDEAAITSFESCSSPTPPYLALRIWQSFTSDQTSLAAALPYTAYEGCGTNLWDAAYDGASLSGDAHNANRMVILLTDGVDTESDKTYQQAIDAAIARDVRLYGIILADSGGCLNIACEELQAMASQTGGLFAVAKRPEDLATTYGQMTNDATVSGCVSARFADGDTVPEKGLTIHGILDIVVEARPFQVPFEIQW